MTLATLIIKESALDIMKRDHPEMFLDTRIHILTWPDPAFNTQLAIEQIREDQRGQTET